MESLGLKAFYSNDPAFQIIVRSFFALAFVRPNDQLVDYNPQ